MARLSLHPDPKSGLRESMDYNAEIDCSTTVSYKCPFLVENRFSLVYFVSFNSNFILIR